MKPLKVLLSAYACEPGKGSEPGVGWRWTQAISRFAEVWVITRTNNRQAIEEALAIEPLPHVHWVYFDLPRWARFWKRGQRGVHLYYYLWQMGIYRIAQKLHRQIGFNIVHHVTFGNYWMPSFLVRLPVPFVLGPVGGGESAPRSFYATFSWRGRFHEYARSLIRWAGEHDPATLRTIRQSAVVLAKAKETALRIRQMGAFNVEVLSEIAWSEAEIAQLAAVPKHNEPPFRFVSIGRLLHWKGFHLGIQAFARLSDVLPQSEYWLIGDGPERSRLKALAQRLGVASRVHFWGAISRDEVLRRLAECDVLVHPSLHDSGGWAVVEAMAAGRPVICLDLGGPAMQVVKETGFKIPAHTPKQAIEEMASAMLRLAIDTPLYVYMGKRGKEHVREAFSRRIRNRTIRGLYEEISNGLSTKK